MIVHSEELRRALLPLADAFAHWKQGNLATGSQVDLVHTFHQGPARELHSRYNALPIDTIVASAIAAGILDRSSMPPAVMNHLARLIAFYGNEDITAQCRCPEF